MPALADRQDEEFAVACVSLGNVLAAYRAVFHDPENAAQHAYRLRTRPDVARRIDEFTSQKDEPPITRAIHADALAEIRDAAFHCEQFKVAALCEIKRGEMMGFYPDNRTSLQINDKRNYSIQFTNLPPQSTEEWAASVGTRPQIAGPPLEGEFEKIADDKEKSLVD